MDMKISNLLAFSMIFLLTAVSGCLKDQPAFSLGVASSMVKVPFDRPFIGPYPDTVEISAAGGEYEAFQLIIHNPERSLHGVRCEAGDLKGEEGFIKSEYVAINPVGYVQTTVVCDKYHSSRGWWPDPLLRMDEFSIPAGEVQPVWITIYVPRGTPAGEYRGSLNVLTENCGVREIPLKLRVWGFEIPLRPNLKTLTWVGAMEKYHGHERGSLEEVEIRKGYYELLLQHRLGPGGNLELSDEMIGFCTDRGMNCFLLEVIPNLKRKNQDNYSAEYKRELTEKLAQCIERFGPRGWLDSMAYVYNYDEVGREHWPLAKEMYKLVKNVSSKLRVIQCLNIPEGVEAMSGYADTWDVYVAQYENTGVEKRVEEGDEVWLAVCCYPASRPNFFLEYPAIDCRLIGWICWFTRVSGFEYWSPNHWGENTTPPGLRGGWVANTFRDYNGDGYLTYPGPDGFPLASVRLANLRDGFEDYEYLKLLEKLQGVTKIADDVVQSPTRYTSDPETVIRTRRVIAERIESLLHKK